MLESQFAQCSLVGNSMNHAENEEGEADVDIACILLEETSSVSHQTIATSLSSSSCSDVSRSSVDSRSTSSDGYGDSDGSENSDDLVEDWLDEDEEEELNDVGGKVSLSAPNYDHFHQP